MYVSNATNGDPNNHIPGIHEEPNHPIPEIHESPSNPNPEIPQTHVVSSDELANSLIKKTDLEGGFYREAKLFN